MAPHYQWDQAHTPQTIILNSLESVPIVLPNHSLVLGLALHPSVFPPFSALGMVISLVLKLPSYFLSYSRVTSGPERGALLSLFSKGLQKHTPHSQSHAVKAECWLGSQGSLVRQPRQAQGNLLGLAC